MIKQITFLSIIYFIAIIYNKTIYKYIISYITIEYYNNIIISFLILVQLDNFTLFYDLSKKIESETNYKKIEDKYLKTILNHINYINYISKKEMKFNKRIIKYRDNYEKIHRSCNDIYNLT